MRRSSTAFESGSPALSMTEASAVLYCRQAHLARSKRPKQCSVKRFKLWCQQTLSSECFCRPKAAQHHIIFVRAGMNKE